MKTILLTILTLTITTGLFASSQSSKDPRLCKIFKEKADTYKKTMRDDHYAQKTLENYQNKTKLFCSTSK